MAVTPDAGVGAEDDRQIRAMPAREAAVDYTSAHQRQAGPR